MNQIDKKILNELIPVLNSVHGLRFDNDFCNNIGLLRQNLNRIKTGFAHFTPKHIQSICLVYNVNANWIFGLETNIYRQIKNNQKSVQTTENQLN